MQKNMHIVFQGTRILCWVSFERSTRKSSAL